MTVQETAVVTVCDALGLDEEQVKPESLLEELGADSLDMVEIAMMLEERFGIDIPDADIESVRTVADFAKVVERRRK